VRRCRRLCDVCLVHLPDLSGSRRDTAYIQREQPLRRLSSDDATRQQRQPGKGSSEHAPRSQSREGRRCVPTQRQVASGLGALRSHRDSLKQVGGQGSGIGSHRATLSSALGQRWSQLGNSRLVSEVFAAQPNAVISAAISSKRWGFQSDDGVSETE